MRKRHIVICVLSGSTIFFHIISHTVLFSKKKKKVIEHKMCFDFLYKCYLKHFSFQVELTKLLPHMYINPSATNVIYIYIYIYIYMTLVA